LKIIIRFYQPYQLHPRSILFINQRVGTRCTRKSNGLFGFLIIELLRDLELTPET